jgi:hypothetical protein
MLNVCQVSLARDIPIILENYHCFKKFYKSFKIFIICPSNQIKEFKEKLNFKEFYFLNEDSIISFQEFNTVFEEQSILKDYQSLFRERLGWYYQQVLKLSFILDFVEINREEVIIWDADTVILKKINFFKNGKSIKYGTLFEFHKHYFKTNKSIIGNHPKYFISFLVQFIGLSIHEYNYFKANTLKIVKTDNKSKISILLAKLILKNIFKTHELYNGSLFSEYELIGISNYMFKKEKQKALFTLRGGLNGKLTKSQLILAKIFNVKHVTYEHSYSNKNNQGMLGREQSWIAFIKLLIKGYLKFNLRNLKHNFYFYYNLINE